MYCSPTPVSPCVYFYITDIIRSTCYSCIELPPFTLNAPHIRLNAASIFWLFPVPNILPFLTRARTDQFGHLLQKGGSHGSQTRKRGGCNYSQVLPRQRNDMEYKEAQIGTTPQRLPIVELICIPYIWLHTSDARKPLYCQIGTRQCSL